MMSNGGSGRVAVAALSAELGPATTLGALGAPPSVVTGGRPSLTDGTLSGGMLGAAGRMLGGGGRRFSELECALGGVGRMLGGGGRDTPRTGGGGGFPDGRESGAGGVPAGRGGSDTRRGGAGGPRRAPSGTARAGRAEP